MATPEATAVNGGPPRAVMLSIAELARRDGVSKPAVSRKVKQLRNNGLQVELDEQGRVSAVHSVQYDELRRKHDDPAKRQVPEPQSETYEEARRQLTWVEAERAKLKLEAEQGQYVKLDQLESAVVRVGEGIVQSVDRLPASADDLAVVVARDGVGGLRAELKKLAHRIRTEIAEELRSVLPS